jgi:hypothetical protein
MPLSTRLRVFDEAVICSETPHSQTPRRMQVCL